MVNPLTNVFLERPAPLGSLLSSAGRRLAGDLDAALERTGFGDLRAAHAPLFMAIPPEGSTSTELAKRAHMTKQAMGELVRYLEQRGYVVVVTASADRRARIIRLTDRGWQAHNAGLAVIAEFDEWLARAIGADQVGQLRQTLQRIITADRNVPSSPERPRAAPRGPEQPREG